MYSVKIKMIELIIFIITKSDPKRNKTIEFKIHRLIQKSHTFGGDGYVLSLYN